MFQLSLNGNQMGGYLIIRFTQGGTIDILTTISGFSKLKLSLCFNLLQANISRLGKQGKKLVQFFNNHV